MPFVVDYLTSNFIQFPYFQVLFTCNLHPNLNHTTRSCYDLSGVLKGTPWRSPEPHRAPVEAFKTLVGCPGTPENLQVPCGVPWHSLEPPQDPTRGRQNPGRCTGTQKRPVFQSWKPPESSISAVEASRHTLKEHFTL